MLTAATGFLQRDFGDDEVFRRTPEYAAGHRAAVGKARWGVFGCCFGAAHKCSKWLGSCQSTASSWCAPQVGEYSCRAGA